MPETTDPYWRLRPAPTPAEDLCSCAGSPPIVLQAHLSENPLSCLACNREVPPERIGFSEALAEKLHHWQRFHDCFFFLWLDSGEFESWARGILEDPASAVNKRGLALAAELDAFRRTYYWWFQDESTYDFVPLSRCPICQAELAEPHEARDTRRRAPFRRWVCEQCSIVAATDGRDES